MKTINLLYTFVVLSLLGIVYNEFKRKYLDDENDHYKIVKKYLLNDTDEFLKKLPDSKLPIIWIHSKYEVNARNWVDFYSRNTKDLNQPYKELTLKTIIDKCGSDFNICLINDESFSDLIPNWNIDIHKVADPIKSNIRELAIAKILDTYGGMLLPDSFICLDSLKYIYNTGIQDDKMFVGELLHTNNVNTPECNMETRDNYYPSTKLMGCAKESQTMKCYINMLETLISQDSTSESVFTGEIQMWLNEKVKRQGINIITSEYLGGRDNNGKLVTLDELMGSTFIEFHDSMLGIYIPDNELLLRSKYSWLSRMSSQQVLESNNVLGKYLVLASGISVSM
tara:strand:- start:1238 stop:2254 length:1017 start_codon:yes stop_codon:yes gene_type:complete